MGSGIKNLSNNRFAECDQEILSEAILDSCRVKLFFASEDNESAAKIGKDLLLKYLFCKSEHSEVH